MNLIVNPRELNTDGRAKWFAGEGIYFDAVYKNDLKYCWMFLIHSEYIGLYE